jgi:2-oxoglutarate dehydrogenase E2 component (dihydrolipoamide succinyltransferase)
VASPAARSFHVSAFAQKKIVEVVPQLGESITEGEIASWCKEVGDSVAVDDVIAIVETDKVTVDIKSTHAGVLTRKIGANTVCHKSPVPCATHNELHFD